MMLPGTDREGTHRAAERLRRAIAAAPFTVGAATVELTVSVGWADWRGEDPSEFKLRVERFAAPGARGGRRRGAPRLLLGEPARELGAGADAELAVGAREVRLDGALRHEQLAGDLAVRPPARRAFRADARRAGASRARCGRRRAAGAVGRRGPAAAPPRPRRSVAMSLERAQLVRLLDQRAPRPPASRGSRRGSRARGRPCGCSRSAAVFSPMPLAPGQPVGRVAAQRDEVRHPLGRRCRSARAPRPGPISSGPSLPRAAAARAPCRVAHWNMSRSPVRISARAARLAPRPARASASGRRPRARRCRARSSRAPRRAPARAPTGRRAPSGIGGRCAW